VPVDIIIPTYDNPYWMGRCLKSIADARLDDLGKIVVVDNFGNFDIPTRPGVHVVSPGKNLGWTKALALGLKECESDYVMFLNDDTEFEIKQDRISLMLEHFDDPEVAAVGPATGTAMGRQAVGGPDIEMVKVLVGFCMVVSRHHLAAVGGINESYELGDDMDLSIRFNKAGFSMILDRRVFVYHHAFKTGIRLFGGARVPGGWNSEDMVRTVSEKLIQEHGTERFLEAVEIKETVPAWP
jgi:GT2 family glycosyltransferase